LKRSFQKMPERSWLVVGLVLCAAAFMLLLHSPRVAADQKKKVEHQKAFAVYQQKCLGCHDSVADPEKPGRTRDDWFLVVNVMHGYGMDLTDPEALAITDLLYDLRKGLEKEAG
jgi:mono/diheme cytochrome c family protein